MYRMDDDDEEEQQHSLSARVRAGGSFNLDDDDDDNNPRQSSSMALDADDDEGRGGPSSSSYRATVASSSSAYRGSSPPLHSSSHRGGDDGDGLGPGLGRAGAGADGMLDPELAEHEALAEVTKLSRAWMEERGAPDLLQWKGDVVESVIDQIEQQVTILDSLSADPSTSQEEHFRLSLVQLDVERARWLLKAYLRTRLRKIETFAKHIISNPNTQHRLSDVELGYVKKYNELQTAHLTASVLSYLPASMRGLADNVAGLSGGPSGNMVVQPDLDEPAFIRCRRDCGQLRLPDGEMVELVQGSIHLLRYSSVQYLVEQGRVEML
ncbi:hypothetical protein V8E36_004954 [Tilletia maclaganii]